MLYPEMLINSIIIKVPYDSLPISQVSPLNPVAHVQLKCVSVSVHVPPLRHGAALHSSTPKNRN